MAGEPNTLAAAGRPRRATPGDAPDDILRRYYLDRDRGGVGFYVDATVGTPAFHDRGGRLTTARNDPNAIRHMAAIAAHRGWPRVALAGTPGFRREAWLAASALGLEVRGYRPTTRDLQALERRRAAAPARDPPAEPPRRPRRQAPERTPAQAHLAAVEAVVRARLVERAEQDRILAAARARIAGWLERGARFEPPAERRRPAERARSH